MRYGICLLGALFCIGPMAALAQPGYIQIKSEPGITIYLGGAYKGITSTSLGGYLISNVPPGTHTVRAEKQGAPKYEVELTVTAGKVTTHEIVDIMKGATVAGAEPATTARSVNQPPPQRDLRFGAILVQSVPMEVQITIPDLGVRGARKQADVWQQTKVPRGTYTAAFKGPDTTLVQRFTVGVGRTTHLAVDFEKNVVTVTDRLSQGNEVARVQQPVTSVPQVPATQQADEQQQVSSTPQRTPARPRRATRPEHAGPHGMIFVAISPGQFQRGSQDGDTDEQPVQSIRITNGFQIGKYEVTQQVWEAVMDENPSLLKSLERPVEMVSWTRVNRFIRQLNEQDTKWTYRLPTEAEWEYAARAGSKSTYSFGNDAKGLGNYAWYNEDTGTQPVGRKEPNAWGLYDMEGNVWEWVGDWYQADYYARGETVDPKGPARGTARVQRGGSWRQAAANVRLANRAKGGVSARSPDVGFRLVRVRR